MVRKLLLTGAYQYSEEQLNILKGCGWEITFVQNELEGLEFPVDSFEAVVCNNLFLYNDIENFTNLKIIQLTSAGTEKLPIDYLYAHGIKYYNAKGVYSIPMAEWAVMNILQLCKKAPAFYKKQGEHLWAKERSLMELTDKQVAIIGYGDVGKEIAKRLKVFGTKIIAVNRSRVSDQHMDQWVSLDRLDGILSSSDIVVISVALAEETRYLFQKKQICLMKQDSILINVSRGNVICEEDLISALQAGWFRGVALDVFAEEPLEKESPLWDFERVIVTPHNSFVSDRTRKRLFEVILNNLKQD